MTAEDHAALEKALTQAAENVSFWLDRRDDLIRRAFEAGLTLRRIGRLVGMSHVGVGRALQRIKEGRPAA